jgi:hypothetical protein
LQECWRSAKRWLTSIYNDIEAGGGGRLRALWRGQASGLVLEAPCTACSSTSVEQTSRGRSRTRSAKRLLFIFIVHRIKKLEKQKDSYDGSAAYEPIYSGISRSFDFFHFGVTNGQDFPMAK